MYTLFSKWASVLTFLLFLWTLPSAAMASTYEHGHEALQLWDADGQAAAPEWVKIWLRVMLVSFLLGIIFVWKHIEARWVVGGLILGLLITRFVIPSTSIPILSGLVALVHVIFWMPGYFLLLTRRPFFGKVSLYSIWTAWITLVISFSFIFDIRDAAIYIHHLVT